MNPIEQLNKQGEVVEDFDQPLQPKQIRELLSSVLGEGLSLESTEGRHNLPVYHRNDGRRVLLLTRSITYLGPQTNLLQPSWHFSEHHHHPPS